MAKRTHTETTDKAPKPKTNEGAKEEQWSKSKRKRMRKLKGREHEPKKADTSRRNNQKPKKDTEQRNEKVHIDERNEPKGRPNKKTGSSRLQETFKARLSGSRFRILNEELYTTTSSTAYDRFSSNPELYQQYHEGFRHQVENWPINPVGSIVNRLKSHISDGKAGKIVVADFGCGDAELAKQLLKVQHKKKCPFKVHSFDLVASSDLVTACDMSDVPLEKGSVDVGIFCLSLMGTNLADFIREAWRVLKDDGSLHIAEVRSRFEDKSDKDTFQNFVDVLADLGFECVKTDRSNKMFVLIECKKTGKAPKKDLEFTAKPCIYKRR